MVISPVSKTLAMHTLVFSLIPAKLALPVSMTPVKLGFNAGQYQQHG
jgi:hypothetical protein